MKNYVSLIGNVGKDPEVRNLESGKKVVTLSLATNEKWRNKDGEKQEETTWHNLVFWNPVSDVVEMYVNKGDRISVDGKIKNRSWKDTEGNTKYITEILVKDLILLSGKQTQEQTPENAAIGEGIEPDDLPF